MQAAMTMPLETHVLRHNSQLSTVSLLFGPQTAPSSSAFFFLLPHFFLAMG